MSQFIQPFQVPVGHTVFVDSEFGNDGSGKINRADKPFATLAAAVTAMGAETLTATAWGTIVVYGRHVLYEEILLKHYMHLHLPHATSIVAPILLGSVNVAEGAPAMITGVGELSGLKVTNDVASLYIDVGKLLIPSIYNQSGEKILIRCIEGTNFSSDGTGTITYHAEKYLGSFQVWWSDTDSSQTGTAGKVFAKMKYWPGEGRLFTSSLIGNEFEVHIECIENIFSSGAYHDIGNNTTVYWKGKTVNDFGMDHFEVTGTLYFEGEADHSGNNQNFDLFQVNAGGVLNIKNAELKKSTGAFASYFTNAGTITVHRTTYDGDTELDFTFLTENTGNVNFDFQYRQQAIGKLNTGSTALGLALQNVANARKGTIRLILAGASTDVAITGTGLTFVSDDASWDAVSDIMNFSAAGTYDLEFHIIDSECKVSKTAALT
jgi:hypothetical protein